MKSNFETDVGELFKLYQSTKEDDIRFFIEKIHSNVSYAIKSSNRWILSFFLCWILSWAIGGEFISEGQISSFKISNLKSLLIVSPLLLGIIYYFITISRLAIAAFDIVLERYFKNTFPDCKAQNMYILLFPPSHETVEDYLLFTEKKKTLHFFAKASMLAFYSIIWILPLMAFSHVSYLLWVSNLWHPATTISSILIGLIFGIRSLTLWISHLE